jgi:amino acid adenylation domain-containing protein
MTAVTVSDDQAMTAKERAQWMRHRLVPGRGICNVGFAFQVRTTLRWWPLQHAVNHLVRRHPALRTNFRLVGTQPRKQVLGIERVTIAVETLAGTEERLAEQITGLIAEPIDIERGPLIKAHLIILPTGSAVCVTLHHLAGDAATVQILTSELVTLYDALADSGEIPPELLDTVPASVEEPPDATTRAYWLRQLAGIDVDRQAIAGARPPPGTMTLAGGRLDHRLSDAAIAALARLWRRTGSTENIVLLAAYYLCLAEHGVGPDIVVGVPASSRRGRMDSTVGYFVNTLPVRVRVDPDEEFGALARTTRDAFLGGLQHSASYEDIHAELSSHSVDWRVPLFRHSFNYRPERPTALTVAGHRVRELDSNNGMSQLDLELIVFQESSGISLRAAFNTEIHDPVDIAAMLARYESLLIALDANPGLPAGQLDLASAADRKLIGTVNDTRRCWPASTVTELIAHRARRTPEALAVGDWTYRRLLTTAEHIRDTLHAHGVRPGEAVGLFAGRGTWLAAAVLGVWAAGAAYLPLDPAHPTDRTRFQLDDARVRTLLADREVPAAALGDRTPIRLDQLEPGRDRDGIDLQTSHSRAYVLYTSGSTGRPKGVEISHANLANVVRYFAGLLDVGRDDRVLWLTTFSFDVSALELLMPLVCGARVVVAPDTAQVEPAALARMIETDGVTVVQATPTTWRQLAPQLRGRLPGARLLCGGEPITPAVADALLASGGRVFNVYGPTETTIWSTVAELSSPVPDRIPIGTPVANTTVLVLDTAGCPVPPGLPGELCIGGAGVAIGYLGDPERTARAFQDVPQLGRCYHTGDTVRLRHDGQLEFLGRTDRQVKVRGHRVELGEIEAVLEALDWVQAAAVLTEADPQGHLRLIAAVRTDPLPAAGPAEPVTDPETALREHAARLLPVASVPGRFVTLTEFPVTGNNKIDYPALARTIANRPAATAPELPADPALRNMITLWREVLGDQTLTAESNFFLSGGHSLIAVELAERIGAALQRDIDFSVVFEAPTPALLAAQLQEVP